MSAYLQPRGDTFAFRIAVPADLREIIAKREIVQALPFDRSEAAAQALELAAQAKRFFRELRREMTPKDKMDALLREARLKLRIDELKDEAFDALVDASKQRISEVKQARIETELNVLRRIAERGSHAPAPATVEPPKPDAPMLSKVIETFLENYRADKKPAMFKKLNPVLGMLLEVIGDKPIDQIKQADINGFFAVLPKLPPKWRDTCKREKITVTELAERDHLKTLGRKTFEDTYMAAVRPFLKAARINWGDQGWPLNLTCEGIEYQGDDEGGNNRQRAFRRAELERLFHGPELQAAATDKTQEHQFWLPAVGLYTGARINEVCQLNPQSDIRTDAETGIAYFLITDEGETEAGVRKSVKTGNTRAVPIHSRLIELGFLDYVERIRATGAKRLFPQWKATDRAAGETDKWFRRLLETLELRDETPGARLVGFHAFRHTLLATGHNASPRIDATPISGHVGGDETASKKKDDAVVRGYQGELALVRKREILESIPFEIDLRITR